jgi:hypothetical protein
MVARTKTPQSRPPRRSMSTPTLTPPTNVLPLVQEARRLLLEASLSTNDVKSLSVLADAYGKAVHAESVVQHG